MEHKATLGEIALMLYGLFVLMAAVVVFIQYCRRRWGDLRPGEPQRRRAEKD